MEIVRESVGEVFGKELTDQEWRRMIHDGYLPETQLAAVQPKIKFEGDTKTIAPDSKADDLELVFTCSDTTYDGRFANNGWLQETPDSITKLTWDNAAVISPKTAEQLGVTHATLVEIAVGDKSLRVPAFILPGQRGLKWCLAITLALAGFFLGVTSVEYSTKWNEGLLWAGDFKPVIDHAARIISPSLLVLGMPALISLVVGGVGVLLLRQRTQLPLYVLSTTVVATSLAFLAGAGTATAITSAQSHETQTAASPPHAATLPKESASQMVATEEAAPPRLAGVFFSIYYAMTGVHAIHILAGMGVIGWLLYRSVRGDFRSEHFGPVDYIGLYWHLVDLVWIYLFPLLYLIH